MVSVILCLEYLDNNNILQSKKKKQFVLDPQNFPCLALFIRYGAPGIYLKYMLNDVDIKHTLPRVITNITDFYRNRHFFPLTLIVVGVGVLLASNLMATDSIYITGIFSLAINSNRLCYKWNFIKYFQRFFLCSPFHVSLYFFVVINLRIDL